MSDLLAWAIVSGATLLGFAILAITALKGWRDWLALQRLSLEGRGAVTSAATLPGPAARIELADLKERVRKLEAIAAGVDL